MALQKAALRVAASQIAVAFEPRSAWRQILCVHCDETQRLFLGKKCGEKVSPEKQVIGKMPFPCPGPSSKEESFLHDIPNKPDGKGRYVCRKCKRGSVKGNVFPFYQNSFLWKTCYDPK